MKGQHHNNLYEDVQTCKLQQLQQSHQKPPPMKQAIHWDNVFDNIKMAMDKWAG